MTDSSNMPVPPDPEEWDQAEMRLLLHSRDITGVYRLLQKRGYTQQQISSMTGQTQPDVSAIIHGRRVLVYDVLVRIGDGLGVPRGYMGLAHTNDCGDEARIRAEIARTDSHTAVNASMSRDRVTGAS